MLPRRKPTNMIQMKTPMPLEQSLESMDQTYDAIIQKFNNLETRMSRMEDMLQQILNQVAYRP